MNLAPDFVMGLRVMRSPGQTGQDSARSPEHLYYWAKRAGAWNERKKAAMEKAH